MTEEIFRQDAYAKTCRAAVVSAGAAGICLDRTVFYARGGGQPGDSGRLVADDGREVPIADTFVDRESGAHLHLPAEGAPTLSPGDQVTCEIDWKRRHRLMRMHTCMHLLSSLVEGAITGCSVGADKGRVDFDLPESPDKAALDAGLNRLIEEDRPVSVSSITDAELAARPDLVRSMSVKPPAGAGRVRLIGIEGADLQPCGGTHVRATGEIGRVRIGKVEKKGRLNRRINILFDG